jgi:hypothetical protein
MSGRIISVGIWILVSISYILDTDADGKMLTVDRPQRKIFQMPYLPCGF